MSITLLPKRRERAFKILSLAIPAGLNSLLDLLSVIVDLFMVGMLSTEAIVAVGVGLNYFMLLYVFTTLFFVGTNALISRFIGAGEQVRANEAFSSLLITSLLFGFPIILLGHLTYEGFFDFIGTASEAKRLGIAYLGVLIYAVPLVLLKAVMVSALSASGDTKTPLKIKCISVVLNVILNYAFIFGKWGFPELGVAGAALSTVLAILAETLLLFYLILGGKKGVAWSWCVRLEYVIRGFKVGIPSSIERCLTFISIFLTAKFIASYGTPELAGYQLATRIEGLAFMPGFGFMIAAMTLMGQNLGAKQPNEAVKYIHMTLGLGAFFMGLLGVLMIFFPFALSSIFSHDEATIACSAAYLFWLGFSQIPLAVVFILDGALRGAGATRITLWVNTLSIWCLRILPAYLIASHQYPFWWIYVVITLETFSRAGLFAFLFHRGVWRRIKV